MHRQSKQKSLFIVTPYLPNSIELGGYEITRTREMRIVVKEKTRLATEPDKVNINEVSHVFVDNDENRNKKSYRIQYNSLTGTFKKTKLDSTTDLIHHYGKFAINLKLFNQCLLYNLLNPNSKKIFNWNIYQLFFTLWSIFNMCYLCLGISKFVFGIKDSISQIQLVLLLTNYSGLYMEILILLILLFKAEDVWNVFDVARFDFLTSKSCQNNVDILKKCCDKIRKITNIYFIIVLLVITQWILFPLIINMIMEKDDSYQRQRNIFDILVPVTTQTYNEFYIVFYLIEITIMIYSTYSILVCGMFLVSFCWIIIAQYDILYLTYKNIGYGKQFHNTTETDVECLNDYYNIITVIADQQRLNSKLQLYYSVIKPIILIMVSFIGILIIFLTVGFSLAYKTTESFSLFYLIRIISSLMFVCSMLFVICYLFGTINIKKDLINFGIYSCNWTNMSLKTKKLMLQTMQMNNANKLVLKVSPKKIIDLRVFIKVVSMCYNIIYVLIKIIDMKKQNQE